MITFYYDKIRLVEIDVESELTQEIKLTQTEFFILYQTLKCKEEFCKVEDIAKAYFKEYEIETLKESIRNSLRVHLFSLRKKLKDLGYKIEGKKSNKKGEIGSLKVMSSGEKVKYTLHTLRN